jgi:C1A family cysteine protease
LDIIFCGFNEKKPSSTSNATEVFDLGDDDSELMWFNGNSRRVFDWREKYRFGCVKNQGKTCGSCWAFAVLTTIEHHLLIHKGIKVDLSEQQLIDCSRKNKGCIGGFLGATYDYIKVN